jgi:hypothetical protein
VIMITAQTVVNSYNQNVCPAGVLSCGDTLKDRLNLVPKFSEFSIHFYESSTAVYMAVIYIYICTHMCVCVCVCACVSRGSRQM